MGGQQSVPIEEQIFNMQFTAKQLSKLSGKHEKDEIKEKKNLVKAIEKGNHEGAKIYAANAIRKKNEALQMLQLSSRIDGVASKLKSISSQRSVARSMGQISNQLGIAMQQMDTMQIASSMDVFERQLQELDVQGEMITTVMDSSTAASTPVDEVDKLIQMTAEENAINLQEKFPEMAAGDPQAAPAAADTQADDLMKRLEALK
jgi:charged multivesicular body protein 1